MVGTPYVEKTGEIFDYKFTSLDHVSGACQVFRRECYEGIGGYAPVKVGTIDCIAVITARMKGWKTRTFTGKVCHHHRKVGTAQRGPMKANFYTGVMDYAMGNHPLWQIVPNGLSNDARALSWFEVLRWGRVSLGFAAACRAAGIAANSSSFTGGSRWKG